MRLNGQQIKQVLDAILSGYSFETLTMMVRLNLDVNLSEVVAIQGSDFTYVVFQLILWTEKNGRTSDLISGALEQNQQNVALVELAGSFHKWQEVYIQNQGRSSSIEVISDSPDSVMTQIRHLQIKGEYGPALDLAYYLQSSDSDTYGLPRLIVELEDMVRKAYEHRLLKIASSFERSALFAELTLDSPLRMAYSDLPVEAMLDFDWVTIPAGEFLMGSDKRKNKLARDYETPQHKLTLPEYRIALVPVTNAQYYRYVAATGRQTPLHWENGKIPPGKEAHPVVLVSWEDAQAFCEWARVRLPTEAEWEKAARGTDGQIWPWGDNEPTKKLCNFRNGDTTAVGSYPDGASPYGCLDMVGNVWEWTSSLYQDYPYDAADGRESPDAGGRRVLRGGSFYLNENFLRCAARLRDLPDYFYVDVGFRVCAAPITPDR